MARLKVFCIAAMFLTSPIACAQYMTQPRPMPAPAPLPEPRAEATLTGRLASANLPSDKRSPELTRDQKDAFKAQYQSMADDDEPPFPIDGLAALYKPIAEAQKSLRLEGPLDWKSKSIRRARRARSVYSNRQAQR